MFQLAKGRQLVVNTCSKPSVARLANQQIPFPQTKISRTVRITDYPADQISSLHIAAVLGAVVWSPLKTSIASSNEL